MIAIPHIFLTNYLKSENFTISSADPCIVIIRTDSDQISYNLIQCATVQAPGYVLCAQKPFPSAISHEDDFRMMYVIGIFPIR